MSAIRYQYVEELELDRHNNTSIARLIADTYRSDFSGRSYYQNRHHRRYLAWETQSGEGQLVGHLAVSFRAITMGEALVDIIGIGEVAVAAAFRRRGIARTLLNNALDDARQSTARFAALFGENPLYQQAGFVPAHNPLTLVEMTGAQTREIVTGPNRYFMVLALAGDSWDHTTPVDLAGFAF